MKVVVVIVGACRTHHNDPAQFASAVADGLHLSVDELKTRVAEACLRYQRRRTNDARSGYQGNHDIDPFIREVAAHAGADDTTLRGAVDSICGR